jgi:tRNA(Ile)-lysidine synthase
MLDIEKKVKAFLVRHVSPGDGIIVAVSGGADSVALLHILYGFREELGFSLSIAHMNHMAREKDSDADAEFVRDLGQKLGLPCMVHSTDVKAEAKNQKTSFQETARNLRYQFLESALKVKKSNFIALGHTSDDQVETFIINLLRGSGARGLSGMPEIRAPFIRPMLTSSRHEVESYLQENDIKFREDSSNKENHYVRNRVRNELLPILAEYNPQIKSTIIDTVSILKDEDQFFEEYVEELLPEFVRTDRGKPEVILSREFFLRQSKAIQKRLIRKALEPFIEGLRRISTVNVCAMIDLMEVARVGKEVRLPGGWRATGGTKSIKIELSPRFLNEPVTIKEQKNSAKIELEMPGNTEWSEFGWHFNCRVLDPGSANFSKGSSQACFDYDKVGGHVGVRFFKPGDRFIPLGMNGRKKLKSFFIDEKIPQEERKVIPLLTSANGDIIWVYGRRISENYKVTEKTMKILRIEGIPSAHKQQPKIS